MNQSRSAIIAELTARLSSIATANGYNTDAGLYVTRDRDSVAEGNAYPRINIYVQESSTAKSGGQRHIYRVTLPIDVEVIARDRSGDPFPVIEQMIDDVKQAVLTDNTLNRTCTQFSWTGDSEADRQPGGQFVAVAVQFSFEYAVTYCTP